MIKTEDKVNNTIPGLIPGATLQTTRLPFYLLQGLYHYQYMYPDCLAARNYWIRFQGTPGCTLAVDWALLSAAVTP
ncbi:hypothetical protein [Legionella parisiensis]|uniref:hypothetical protein n=1 Tax=Legionella parisiensis TaxID=45071 RepID=UPI000730B95F|nr:hypothetical protein [Legionella parisiensis]